MPRPLLTVATLVPAKPPGRPREFDVEEALDKAVGVFCARGFHGTSISDLSRGMGVAPGSLYKAFRDKRDVFLAAFDRQAAKRGEQLQAAVAQGRDGRDRLHRTLLFYATLSCGAEGRTGCLVVATAAEIAGFDKEIEARVAASLKKREELLCELLRQGQRDGSVAARLDVKATARCLLCLLQGLRVVGKLSPPRAETLAAVDAAMKMLD